MQPRIIAAAIALPQALAIRSLPVRVALPSAPEVFGLSRSAIYRAAAAGHIKLTKLGRSTLVDTASVLEFLNSLPSYNGAA